MTKSECRADPTQLSSSENVSDPIYETIENDVEETVDPAEKRKSIIEQAAEKLVIIPTEFASEEDKAAFDLLGDYYTSDAWVYDTYGETQHSGFHVSGEGWEISEDYELFRKYFFGSWGEGENPLVIDDSEIALFAENWRMFFLLDYYKVSEDVLAFLVGSAAGGTLYWLDRNEPDILYRAEEAPGGFPNGILPDENGFPNVWVLHKNGVELNEPQNNYLSVYRLREMAKKYGIDYSMLVDVEWKEDALYHDSRYYFYPMYLVSEEDNRIEILTQAGDPYSYAVDIRIILQNIDGEWTREVVSVQ